MQQVLSLLYKSGTIKNIILLHAVQVISHLCFFNDKVEYPIRLQAGATLPKIGARYITAIPSSVRGQDYFLSIRRNVPNQGVANRMYWRLQRTPQKGRTCMQNKNVPKKKEAFLMLNGATYSKDSAYFTSQVQ